MSNQLIEWCGVPVAIDDAITELFEMPAPDQDPDQKPEFRVTSSTADLVRQDFELYKPSLERMADNWQEEKKRFMQDKESNHQDRPQVLKGVQINDRVPGTQRNRGSVLMATGVSVLLLFIILSLGETTITVAWVRSVEFIAGTAVLAAGAVFYMLARTRLP